jgi:hypothetical protein
MIIKVSKYNGQAKGHQYNISKENAELIISTMISKDADSMKREFMDLRELNPRCVENYQFVMSLAQGESFDNQKWNDYIQEVLDEFGLKEHKYYAVQHNDTDNQHIHLVVSGVNLEGKPSPKMRGFYKLRASELALKISKRDQHQKPVKGSKTNTKGVNQARYSLDKIVRTAIKSSSWAGKKLKAMSLDLGKARTNKEWERIIYNKGVLRNLKKSAHEFNYKTKISGELARLKKQFETKEFLGTPAWIKFCEDQGLYARQIKKDGSIKYGMNINGKWRYFNENQLNQKFDKEAVAPKKKTYMLDRVIKQQVLYSSSLKELNNRLQKNQISMNLRINATGLYGVVFQDMRTGQSKPLSSLGLKIGAIKQLLNPQELSNIEKLSRQKTSLTVSTKIIIFEPTNSKFINQSVKNNPDIHSSINANAAKILDREQYENQKDDFYDRRKKTL